MISLPIFIVVLVVFTCSVKATLIDIDPKDVKPEHSLLIQFFYTQKSTDDLFGVIDKITKVQMEEQPSGFMFYYEYTFRLFVGNCSKHGPKKPNYKDCVKWVSCRNMSSAH